MEREIKVCPSLLAADFLHLESDLLLIKDAGIEIIHYDVMDGHFVPNISFGPAICKTVKPLGFIMDVHLMVTELERIIPMFVNAGADYITFHLEARDNIEEFIIDLKTKYPHIKWGISIKPKTDIKCVLPLLKLFDLVLVMSVEPGFGGQSFMEESITRIADIKKYISDNNLNTVIEVDGGINESNAQLVIDAGATMIVAGTSVFKSDDIKRTCNILGGKKV